MAIFEDRETSIGYLTHEIARLMRRRFEEEAREQGVTLPQWRTLVEVMKSDGTITQVALAGCIDADPMTVSGILDRLEKRGLVERYTDPSDSRAKRVRMTATGNAVVEDARNLGRDMYEKSLAGVSASDRAATIRALQRIRDNLSGVSAEQKEAV